jgi:hypothetical protein
MDQLNAKQQKLYDYFVNWIDTAPEERDQVINFSGCAGSGKTHIIKHLVRYIKTEHPKLNVCCLAPTNKAVSVIKKKRIGVYVSTIHKHFGIKMMYNEYGKLVNCHTANQVSQDIVIVDESSMLTNELYEELINTRKFIVFFGDVAQLPPICNTPVMESIVYRLHPIVIELDEIMRNKTLGDGYISPLRTYITAKNIPEYLGLVYKAIQNETKQIGGLDVSKEFMKSDDSQILCYTNKNVGVCNKMIRANIFGSESKNKFCNGESIVWNEFYEDKDYITRYTSDKDIIDNVTVVKIHDDYTNESYILYQLTIQTTDDGEKKIYSVHERSKTLFEEKYYNKKREIEHVLIQNKSKDANEVWDEFFSNKKFLDAPIGYGYAQTIHKSQGSEYETVFCCLDFDNMFGAKFKPNKQGKWVVALTEEEKVIGKLTFLKLLYTAISRATKNCYVFRLLPVSR